VSVRTTLTLDEDVAAKLDAEARRSGRPVRAVVNEALRAGLEAAAIRKPPPYRVQARDLGLRPGFEIDDIWGLIERVEGPEFK
jgi:hypothetical protein